MMKRNYDDIVMMERPVSKVHKPMSLSERAAQFSPFAALEGYGDVINQQSIIYEDMVQLSEENIESINECLKSIRRLDRIKIKYYNDGRVFEKEVTVKRFDPVERYLAFDNEEVSFENLIDIRRLKSENTD